MIKVGIFASGNGSNAQTIIDYCATHATYKVMALVCDQKDAFVIERARMAGIPVLICTLDDFDGASKVERQLKHEQNIIEQLEPYEIDLICLAGYMRLLSSTFLQEYSRVINIHPSLLPKYPGLLAFKKAYESNDSHAGVTIHWVDEGMDTGEVIIQDSFAREDNDTFLNFEKKGRVLEQKLYPKALEIILPRFLKNLNGKSYESIAY